MKTGPVDEGHQAPYGTVREVPECMIAGALEARREAFVARKPVRDAFEVEIDLRREAWMQSLQDEPVTRSRIHSPGAIDEAYMQSFKLGL